MIWLGFILLCAFLVGMTISASSTCAVAASREILFERRPDMLLGFVIAMGVAGLVTLPLHWLVGPAAHVSSVVPVSASLVLGAVLIGLGAVVNDACLLGTLARIGQGEVRFLALPFGLALGFAVADRPSGLAAGVALPNPLVLPSIEGALIVFLFAVMLIWAWRRRGLKSRAQPAASRWPRAMMLAMGLCGALLFSFAPQWTYSDAIHAIVRRGGMQMQTDTRAFAPAIALLAGALVSGLLTRAFVFRAPTTVTLARSLAGGAIMALGGTLIPGGNDSLLLAAIPAASLSGITAYAVMSATVMLVLAAGQRLRPVAQPV
ncbi:YeeE/YedE thiosulfate transporter family protein [Blastomonas sp.]|jgi:uncharacterized protein|uniref:YeeE/YedE thiosulfate transporter family protein n=1 Tax=Blastomonas sp. TaxID=1909299 RepID=UPI00406AAE84